MCRLSLICSGILNLRDCPKKLFPFGFNIPKLASAFSVDAVVDRVTRSPIASTNQEYLAAASAVDEVESLLRGLFIV